MIGLFSSRIGPLLYSATSRRMLHHVIRKAGKSNYRGHVYEIYGSGSILIAVVTEHVKGKRWGVKSYDYSVDTISHGAISSRKTYTENQMQDVIVHVKQFNTAY